MPTSTGWIEQLMPIENQIFLDHVGFFASSLEIAAHQLARLGFQVSPVNIHYSANDAGELVPTGTSNRLVVLGLGYLEVLAGSGVTPLAEELCKALTFYEGLHLIGLSHPNMAAQRERLTGAGFAMQQIIELRRRIETPAGERQLVCSVLRTIPGEMAEGRVQMLTNYTPDLVWRTESTIHKNGADALTDILICVENPAKEVLRYERYTGRSAANTGASDVIALDRGRIVLVAPDVAQKMLPGLTLPRLPFIAGVAVRTASIHITKSVLAENGVEPTIAADDLFCIGKADAVGGYLLFHSKSIDAPWQSLYSQIAGR